MRCEHAVACARGPFKVLSGQKGAHSSTPSCTNSVRTRVTTSSMMCRYTPAVSGMARICKVARARLYSERKQALGGPGFISQFCKGRYLAVTWRSSLRFSLLSDAPAQAISSSFATLHGGRSGQQISDAHLPPFDGRKGVSANEVIWSDHAPHCCPAACCTRLCEEEVFSCHHRCHRSMAPAVLSRGACCSRNLVFAAGRCTRSGACALDLRVWVHLSVPMNTEADVWDTAMPNDRVDPRHATRGFWYAPTPLSAPDCAGPQRSRAWRPSAFLRRCLQRRCRQGNHE